jgi:hypothetical protein
LAEITVIRTNRVRSLLWLLLVAIIVGVGIDVAASLGLHLPSSVPLLWIPAGVVAGVCLFILVIFVSAVREVRCSADQVEFVKGGEVIRLPWRDLLPPTYPYYLGSIVFLYRKGGVVQFRGFGLSREQARGMLAYPACPRFDLTPEILRSIGLEAYPRSE